MKPGRLGRAFFLVMLLAASAPAAPTEMAFAQKVEILGGEEIFVADNKHLAEAGTSRQRLIRLRARISAHTLNSAKNFAVGLAASADGA